MRTIIDTIPHSQQRYPTVGDYWDDGEVGYIVVSDLGNERMEFLIQIHEMIEKGLCRFAKIPEPKIKAFDERFEKKRKNGNTDEPGFDSKAPYRRQHTIATGVEMLLAAELGIDINEYERKVNAL